MGLNVRKFVVGVLALSVLAGLFLLYLRFNRAPPILVEVGKSAPAPAAVVRDANSPESMGTISGVGGVRDLGVGGVRDTLFLHRDEDGRLDRRFGFHELLFEQGNQWAVTKPFMDLLLPEAACRVTADRGTVQVDTTLRQPTLSDAVFSGNVVIHIIPSDPNNAWESYIHLDDVGFLAEKSMFSSTGAVRFLSRNVRLAGTGMELRYDLAHNRLERFRVFELDSLRLRSAGIQALAAVKGKQDPNDEAAHAAESVDAHTVSLDSAAPVVDTYQCVFRGNVRLGATQGVVLARDVFSINNIPWPRSSVEEKPAGKRDREPNEPNVVEPLPPPGILDTRASSHLAMTAIAEELYDMVVTCDGGFEIGLVDALRESAASADADRKTERPPATTEDTPVPGDRQYVAAQRIDVDIPTGDSTLLGPVALQVFVDPNAMGEEAGGEPMPMTVTAQQAVRFLRASEQVTLEGDCTATLLKSDPTRSIAAGVDLRDEYRLQAPRLVLDLAFDANDTDDATAQPRVDLRKLVADAGTGSSDALRGAGPPPVGLSVKRRAGNRFLGWLSLDVSALEYVADSGQVLASGPGVIFLHNAETIESKSDPNQRLEPCYARLTNFDTLEYRPAPKDGGDMAPARVIAADDARQLVLRYIPLIDGGAPGAVTQVVAGHVEATFRQIAQDQMGLVSLIASEGIAYEHDDETRGEHVSFDGAELVYDHERSRITVQGDELRPCRLNGAFVDSIVVDRKAGQVTFKVPTASVFQVNP